MRKLFTFLLTAVLATVASSLRAEEVPTFEPDQIFTSLTEGDIVAIYNAAEDKFIYGSDAQNLGFQPNYRALKASNSGYLFQVEKYNGHYLFLLQKPDGSGKYEVWGNPGYLNSQPNATGGCCFILGLNNQWGQDGENLALWDLEPVDGGFLLKNVGNGYFNGYGAANKTVEEAAVWTFCTLKATTIENPIEKPTRTATDALVLSFDDFGPQRNGAWDAETKTFTGTCGFSWTEGIDLSQYQYLSIVAGHSRKEAGAGYVEIKDKNGTVVGGDAYGEAYFNMWMSNWNHHYNCMIDLEKLRSEQLFDIYDIVSLTIDGGDGFVISTVYASNTKPITQPFWGSDGDGSFKITGKTAEQFGTVCLPYQAAVACAKVYEIAGLSSEGIELVEVDGLMEAGKPYIYWTTPNANPTAVPENKVFFYQATDATVSEPVENNGLIGTFEAITINNTDFYVLSGNQLYYADQEVNVGANKAYIDITKIGATETKGNASISFADATGIENIQMENLNGKIYDLSGREVVRPAKGFYIANGKKMFIK